jgi:hypothetical protein
MCDYSLCGIPNRLAAEGEELVVHKFSTGSMGLACPADLPVPEALREPAIKKTFWQSFILKDIPADLQRQCRVSEEEGVMFTQLSADVNSYRDAIRFSNGYQIRLQDLREGMRVEVLSLAGVTEYTPAMSEALR